MVSQVICSFRAPCFWIFRFSKIKESVFFYRCVFFTLYFYACLFANNWFQNYDGIFISLQEVFLFNKYILGVDSKKCTFFDCGTVQDEYIRTNLNFSYFTDFSFSCDCVQKFIKKWVKFSVKMFKLYITNICMLSFLNRHLSIEFILNHIEMAQTYIRKA